MQKEDSVKTDKPARQKYFCARELQFSIALLIVLALLGGIFLQAVSSAVVDYYKISSSGHGIILIVGYVAIVVLLAVFYTHRLVSPFVRLEYEMKLIAAGNIGRKLSVRAKDDLHIRNFVAHTNKLIAKFEDMSREYNRVNSTVSKKLEEIKAEIQKKDIDCAKVGNDILELQKQIHELREKW